MKRVIVVMSLLMLVSMAGLAMAVDTANVQVTANVMATCRFQSINPIAFTVDPLLGGNQGGTANLVFQCANGVNYTLNDSDGVGDVGLYTGNLASGGNTMAYSVSYTNAQAASTGVAVTSLLTATVTQAAYNGKPAGSYTDTIVFTITP